MPSQGNSESVGSLRSPSSVPTTGTPVSSPKNKTRTGRMDWDFIIHKNNIMPMSILSSRRTPLDLVGLRFMRGTQTPATPSLPLAPLHAIHRFIVCIWRSCAARYASVLLFSMLILNHPLCRLKSRCSSCCQTKRAWDNCCRLKSYLHPCMCCLNDFTLTGIHIFSSEHRIGFLRRRWVLKIMLFATGFQLRSRWLRKPLDKRFLVQLTTGNHNSILLQPIFGDHTDGLGCCPGRNQLR